MSSSGGAAGIRNSLCVPRPGDLSKPALTPHPPRRAQVTGCTLPLVGTSTPRGRGQLTSASALRGALCVSKGLSPPLRPFLSHAEKPPPGRFFPTTERKFLVQVRAAGQPCGGGGQLSLPAGRSRRPDASGQGAACLQETIGPTQAGASGLTGTAGPPRPQFWLAQSNPRMPPPRKRGLGSSRHSL